MSDDSTTLDGLLNRRVLLEQPANGYRVAIDTVFCAAAVPAVRGERVLDMGCGVGGILLALACRTKGLTGLGIERQAELVDIARRNLKRNSFASGFVVQEGNIIDVSDARFGAFDHVVMNPPYHEEIKHDVSTNLIKRTANTEKEGELVLWIEKAINCLNPSGCLTLIHRADRCGEILKLVTPEFGKVEVLPLLPKNDGEAKRIIFRARKGTERSLHDCRPIVLHRDDGGYTDTAESVLRHAQPLDFQSP